MRITWCAKDTDGTDLVDLDQPDARVVNDRNGEALCPKHGEEELARRSK